MGFWECIVIIVFITTLGKVLSAAFGKSPTTPAGLPPSHVVHSAAHGSAADRAYLEALAGEVRALRAEVEQLRTARATAPVTGGSLPRDVAERVNALTEEMHSLRDTTTQFDMTFDAALDRLERRLERVEEGRVSPAEGQASAAEAAAQQAQRWYTGTAEETPQQQTVGQR